MEETRLEADAASQGDASANNITQDDAQKSRDSSTQWNTHLSLAITQYLLDKVPEFRRLTDLRQKGWKNREGDEFFHRQREIANNRDAKTAKIFYKVMKQIGREMQQSTGVFTLPVTGSEQPTVLDICMAPGGYTKTALDVNPQAHVTAFSLPFSDGGYRVLLQKHPNRTTKFLDITMLAADMGVTDIPASHPDSDKFLPRQLSPAQLFDLVICDGNVRRQAVAAALPAHREKREASRLTAAQLALGLEHVRPGGAMVVLLHKVEAWQTACLLRRFGGFAQVRLFKPAVHHAKRSSFYMVATDIQSRHPEAVLAVESWKGWWKAATFGSDEEYQEALRAGDPDVEEILEGFGPELVRLGKSIWDIQVTALAKAPFVRNC